MNDGVIAGVAANDWKSYQPTVRGVLGNDTSPDPVFDPQYPQYQQGRYIVDNGTVRGWVQLGLVGTFSAGTGAWVIKLPVPARRPHESLPCVLGTGMVYYSFVAPYKNVKGVAILADSQLRYQATNNAGSACRPLDDPDSYLQLQCPYQLRHGSGTISSGTFVAASSTGITTAAVSGGKYSAADRSLVFTEVTQLNNCEPSYFTGSLTDSTETWAFQAATGAKAVAYKVRADALSHRNFGTHANVPTSIPMTGNYHPFDLSELTALGPFGNIFISFRYAPA